MMKIIPSALSFPPGNIPTIVIAIDKVFQEMPKNFHYYDLL